MKGWFGGMPRPPQQVPPETLGGLLRAARRRKNLSLAEVAGTQYSTSLISQIERNRIEPSEGSLRFLAKQLDLSFEELLALSQQQKDTDDTAAQLKFHEDLRRKASEAFINKNVHLALNYLQNINFPLVPQVLRWRLATLRGQCYFTLRQFLAAQHDFLYAVTEKPAIIPEDMRQEAVLLHLHFAATLRELEQPEAALKEYGKAFELIERETPAHTIAEAYWGQSLCEFELAYKTSCDHQKEEQLKLALQHANHASLLYRTIGEHIRASLLTCQIGLIEQTLGQIDIARTHLLETLQREQLALHNMMHVPASQGRSGYGINQGYRSRLIEEQANAVSALACTLAGIELEICNYAAAHSYAEQALDAGKLSYTLRQAEAEMMIGRILETENLEDRRATEAFQRAVTMLDSTDRIAARIRAHNLLGRHLLKSGDISGGEQELDRVLQLSNVVSAFNSTVISIEEEIEEDDDIGRS
jgi:transcriptional regulator with XRE-family HTH domain